MTNYQDLDGTRTWGYWMQANRKLLAKGKKRQVNDNIRDFNEEKETW